MQNDLAKMISDGWAVAGYSNFVMAAGAVMHSVLLQKDGELVAANVVKMNGKEIGRSIDKLT